MVTITQEVLHVNTKSGGLGKREMLWEDELTVECFYSFCESCQNFISISIQLDRDREPVNLFLLENYMIGKLRQLVDFNHQNTCINKVLLVASLCQQSTISKFLLQCTYVSFIET